MFKKMQVPKRFDIIKFLWYWESRTYLNGWKLNKLDKI